MREGTKCSPDQWWLEAGRAIQGLQKGAKKFWGVTDMFVIFIMIMTFRVYTCVKTYQIIQLNKCDLLYVNYSSI